MNLNRRKFLKIAGAATLALPNVVFGDSDIEPVVESTKDNSKDIIIKEIEFKLEKSKKSIGNIEYNHFIKYFGLTGLSSFEILERIEEIQYDLGFRKVDGILGSKSLEVLYKNIYSKDLENVSSDIIDRWEAYIDMVNMKPRIKGNKRIYGRFNKNNVFDKRHWTGLIGNYSEEGSYIDDNLKNKVEYNISDIHCNVKDPETKVVGILKKIEGKYVTLIYDKGKLILASYSSPGIKNGRSGYNKTRKGVFISDMSQKNFVSSVKAKHITGNRYKGAPMYYMVGIYGHGGVGSHYSPTVNGNRASHQCLRQNMKTAKRIHYIDKNIGKIHWDVQDN